MRQNCIKWRRAGRGHILFYLEERDELDSFVEMILPRPIWRKKEEEKWLNSSSTAATNREIYIYKTMMHEIRDLCVGKVNLNSYLNLYIRQEREKNKNWLVYYICELWEKPAGACIWQSGTHSVYYRCNSTHITHTHVRVCVVCESLEICNESCVCCSLHPSLSRLAGQNGESVSFRFGPFKNCPGISFFLSYSFRLFRT